MLCVLQKGFTFFDQHIHSLEIELSCLLPTQAGSLYSSTVTCLSISSDGTKMAVGTDDGALQLFDISGSVESSTPGAPPLLSLLQAPGSGVTTVAVSLSGDGSVLVAGAGQSVLIWWQNGSSWLLLYTLTGHTGAVRSVAVSLTGHHAHSGGCDATVRAWDLTVGLQAGPAMAIGGSSSCATLVAVAADGRSVAAAGDSDPLLRFWATWQATSG